MFEYCYVAFCGRLKAVKVLSLQGISLTRLKMFVVAVIVCDFSITSARYVLLLVNYFTVDSQGIAVILLLSFIRAGRCIIRC